MTINFEAIASSQIFQKMEKSEQATVFVWATHRSTNEASTVVTISDLFEKLGFPRPNPTRLRLALAKSKMIRKGGKEAFLPTREASMIFDRDFDFSLKTVVDFKPDQIERPPHVSENLIGFLGVMIEFYSYLFLLENSIRGFIAGRLSLKYGPTWWVTVASTSMQKKHSDRTDKETNNRWAPARSDLGPLYSIDWPDLITLIRKEHDSFRDRIPDLTFLHRYEDLGHYRNVVAHHGVLDDPTALDRVKLYYYDWLKQVS